jgi:DNA-directed RNA polymerase II subunit RPB1
VENPGGRNAEDDITQVYRKILLTNKQTSDSDPTTKYEFLSRVVASLFNNETAEPLKTTSKSKPYKTLRQRLKGKEGRVRGNLMGKRVDFSARTVVSPDPNLALDELGVPKQLAMKLTFPEVVSIHNKEKLDQMVKNRGEIWPGANFLRKKDGEIRELSYAKMEENTAEFLELGDVVERHLIDGDFVIFNRQPSLHKMSMMGHRIKVLPHSSFRLNLSVTTPYNADFDGDEMNMHVPQNYQSKAEIMNLMHVPLQIVSPQNNRPVMGIVQDTLVGVYLFTLKNVFLDREEMMNLMMFVNPWKGKLPRPAIRKPRMLWTGKQILSEIIPKIDYIANGRANLMKDNVVVIQRGELLAGFLAKAHVGASAFSLLGKVWLDKGPTKAAELYAQIQKVVNNWLTTRAFTVGVCDAILEKSVQEKVNEVKKKITDNFEIIFNEAQKEAENRIMQPGTNSKWLETQPGKGILDCFELSLNMAGGNLRAKVGSIIEESTTTNNITSMIKAGSKGGNDNLSQILGLVGQQNV